jgi:Sec-independent protein translocase protein TatA
MFLALERAARSVGLFLGQVKSEMRDRKSEVTAELDRRAKKEDEHAKQVQKVEQAKAVAMEGQSTLDKYKTTPEMCDEAFAKAAASAGLPLNLVDNQHFRTFLAKVATCGSKFLKGHDDVQLSHSKKMTEKVLPKADEDIDKQARGPVDAMAADLGGAMVSDGWLAVVGRLQTSLLQLPLRQSRRELPHNDDGLQRHEEGRRVRCQLHD